MQLTTILNRVQKFKSFVYGAVRWVEGASIPTLEVEMQPRSNSRPECSGCGQRRPGYDRLPERRFEFIPMWGHKVFFVYAPLHDESALAKAYAILTAAERKATMRKLA